MVVALALIGVALACGPEFPNIYYGMTERELLRGPTGVFAAEIARLASRRGTTPSAVRLPEGGARAHTLAIDVADVKRALAERGVTQKAVEWEYERVRQELETWIVARRPLWTEEVRGDVRPTGEIESNRPAPIVALPVQVPREFHLYLEGAVAWHQGGFAGAREAWLKLLALPPAERRFRTTWAVFMLGRVEGEAVRLADREDPVAVAAAYDAARQRMREVRALAAEGWPDPLGLAAASLGWEARAALEARDDVTALRLYLEQHATGDETALASLRRAAHQALYRSDRDLGALAKSPDTRRVVTAYLVGRQGPSHLDPNDDVIVGMKTWASALEAAGVTEVAEADRLAWLAYDAGLFALAERWAGLAPVDAAEVNWIRAKLALRRGNVDQGEQLLRAALAAKSLGEEHRTRVLAELNRVCLARDNYAGALDAAMLGAHWADAAFVAERVMSLAELQAFVDARPAIETVAVPVSRRRDEPLEEKLRHLLARRLARAGKAELADRYFPAKWREKFRSYVESIRIGFDVGRADADRAAAFWQAARLAREDGLGLLGTELEPDGAIWGGLYPGSLTPEEQRRWLAREGDSFAPTPVELQRLEAHVMPAKRHHYRYRAAELAWWAASLLPNDADETAEILNTAGGWLKARDPAAAQPFYQALVIRCGKTALGQAAAKAKWFPKPEPAGGAKL